MFPEQTLGVRRGIPAAVGQSGGLERAAPGWSPPDPAARGVSEPAGPPRAGGRNAVKFPEAEGRGLRPRLQSLGAGL